MKREPHNWIVQAANAMKALVIVALVGGWISLTSYMEHVERTSPRSPNAVTGEIVPVHWKGVVLYMRPFNAQLETYRDYGVVAFGIAIILASLLWKRPRKSN